MLTIQCVLQVVNLWRYQSLIDNQQLFNR